MSTADSATRLRASSPAPATRTTARAISATTNAFRAHPPRAPIDEPLPALPQSVDQLDARGLQRGRETEEHARDERDRDGEEERGVVHADLVEPRQVRRRQRDQPQHAEPREPGPEQRRREAEDGALRQQLPDQAAARRADGGAHDHLAVARRGARELQVRHVGAGDEQHQRDGAEQRVERRARAADELLLQRHDVGQLAGVGGGILRLEPRGDRRQFRRAPGRSTRRRAGAR